MQAKRTENSKTQMFIYTEVTLIKKVRLAIRGSYHEGQNVKSHECYAKRF